MFDRLLMPALTFMLLASASAAFTVDGLQRHTRARPVVQLERVVITAQRDMPATPVAQAEPLRRDTVAR